MTDQLHPVVIFTELAIDLLTASGLAEHLTQMRDIEVKVSTVRKHIRRRTRRGDPPPTPAHTDRATGTRYWHGPALIAWWDAASHQPGRPRKDHRYG